MQLARRDADFAAESELAAIGELGRGVDQHDRGVDAFEEALGRRFAFGNDRLGMLRAVAGDMLDGAVNAVDGFDGDDGIEIFLTAVVGRRPFDTRIDLWAAASPRTSQPASSKPLTSGGRKSSVRVLVDEQALRRAADAGAPHLGVEDELDRHVEFGAAVDVGVADAFEMREDGNARLVLHALDEALAAARHDHVDGAVRPRSMWPTASRSVVGTSWIAASGRPAARKPATRQAWIATRGMMALGAAAQDRGVACFQAERAGVCRHVGAAFVNDADDAERHADALELVGRWAASSARARCQPDRAARRSRRAPWRSRRCALRRA